MSFDHVYQSARNYLSVATQATADACRQGGAFIKKHREVIAGSVGGYVAGRAIESIPFVGRLLSPVASVVLGIGGGALGYQKSLERRRLEALERGIS